MAPSRRKGASKAAAAAAARRQFKVGDLVLAKVKGFPAWPATVSEPEKWGYSSDMKKVMVYFFGTQQIAFCNPVDVEAFTEEKKQNLLAKRQVRGADFVRAVKEITDSYEKLKRQGQVDSNSANEVTLANGGNSGGSSAQNELKERAEVSEATLDSPLKPLNSTTAGDDPLLQAEDTHAARQSDALLDKEALSEQPPDNVDAKEKRIFNTYSSRKRSGSLRSQNTQTKAPSTRSSRSSSRIESCRLRSFMIPYNDDVRNVQDASANVSREKPLRRTRRTRKSADASECDDLDSSAFTSNVSVEDNGSEIVTAESDAFSLNEGSTVDSGCKVENLDTVVDCLEGDVEFSKGLDFHIKAVVIKKKRKPNRKRLTNDTADPPARMELEADVEVGTHKSSQLSPHICENLDERHTKDGGDEHLPLLKRARVRMGKPASAEELKTSLQAEEKSFKDVAMNLPEQVSQSLNHDDDGLVNGEHPVTKGALDNVSTLKECSQSLGNRSQLWNGTINTSFGCSADGEAVLPPSKRLHRALEAMSANAAEEGQACIKTSSTMDTTNVSSSRSSVLQTADSLGNNVSDFDSSSNAIVLEESMKSCEVGHTCDQHIKSPTSEKLEICEDVVRPMDTDDSKAPISSSVDPNIKTVAQSGSLELLDQSMPSDDGGHSGKAEWENFGADNANKEADTLAHSEPSLDPTLGSKQSAKCSPQNGVNLSQYSTEGMGCDNIYSLKSQIDDSCINGMSEVVEEFKYKEKPKDTVSVSCSDDMAGKDALVIQLGSSPVDQMDSPARVSLHNPSLCHISTSESANMVQNNGSVSPNIHLQQKKILGTPVADEDGKTDTTPTQRPKSVGRWSNYSEAHSALSSFEAMLGALTRTKESIGRATRIAIDCAKFGVSAKVVEILVRSLESEPNLHRRIDQFFLVDSITQCSRGLKGDGGVYPSAIQAVLPRLLSAAAPSGNTAQENRRQCLKVLRLWLERRILPESVIRQHIRELDSFTSSSSAGAYSRRTSRTERSLDDPVRDMEGMLVDEYGSNSSLQLPGFCMPRMLKDEDEGSDSDGESFEAVTPEHKSPPDEQQAVSAIEKHRHILEDVDGELEMEDVAPSCDIDMNSTKAAGTTTSQPTHDQLLPFAPPLPHDVPPSSPPLPSSPPPPHPPPPPPPPPLPHPSAMSDSYSSVVRMHNMQNGARPSVAEQSLALNPPNPNNPIHYNTPECRDTYDSRHVCTSNNARQTDAPRFHHKPFPPRPPLAPPSDQFSYVQASHHMKSRREGPPHSHRFHSRPSVDDGNFYNNHDRMKPAPYEHQESWRFPPPFSGSRYPENSKESYPPGPYMGPPCEPTRLPSRDWAYPPRPSNHRNSLPFRPPSGGPIPVGIRGPGIWPPR